MLAFFTANLSTIVVAALVALALGFVIYTMLRDKKAGKSSCSCGGGCSGCPGSEFCHSGK